MGITRYSGKRWRIFLSDAIARRQRIYLQINKGKWHDTTAFKRSLPIGRGGWKRPRLIVTYYFCKNNSGVDTPSDTRHAARIECREKDRHGGLGIEWNVQVADNSGNYKKRNYWLLSPQRRNTMRVYGRWYIAQSGRALEHPQEFHLLCRCEMRDN